MTELKVFYSQLLLNSTPIVIITLGLLISIIILFVIAKIFKKYRQESAKHHLLGYVGDRLQKPVYTLILLLLLQMVLPNVIGTTVLFDLNHIFQPLLVITFSWFLVSLVYLGEDWLKLKYNVDKIDNIRERRIRTSILFIKRMLIILISLFAISLILMNFQDVRKLGAGILTSAGILGIIVGFAAQKSLANLLAGLQIAFTQPIRIDDVLVVEGEWGRVEEITFTYVVIRIWDQRRLILPINYFLEKPIQNWTRRTAELIGTVFIYTDYNIDVEALRNALTQILQSTTLWDGRVNVLQVTDATEKTLQLRALVSSRNSPDNWDLRCLVRERLLAYIQNNFPHALPKLNISITNKNESVEKVV